MNTENMGMIQRTEFLVLLVLFRGKVIFICVGATEDWTVVSPAPVFRNQIPTTKSVLI